MPKAPLHLTISEIAKRCGVAASALRFYETKGLIQSTRTPGNQRRYHSSVVRRVSVIQVAQNLGLTLEEISQAFRSLPNERTPTKRDWEKLSRRWRHQLDERISRMQDMRDKLTDCIGCGCLSMQNCSLYNKDDNAASKGTGPRYLLGDSPSE